MTAGRAPGRGRTLWRDLRGASSIEFALVAAPFFFFLLGVMQVGIYYVTQTSLDAGVVETADSLRSNFSGATPTYPNASSLKSTVVSNAGGMISNSASLSVEIRQLSALKTGAVPITDATVDYGSAKSTLVLRAETSVVTFAPGFGSLAKARSSAIIRRQDH